jgi:hypothetical protein
MVAFQRVNYWADFDGCFSKRRENFKRQKESRFVKGKKKVDLLRGKRK